MLAGLTRSPNYYNPRSNFYTRNTEGSNTPDITNNRTDYVLRQMREKVPDFHEYRKGDEDHRRRKRWLRDENR